MTPDEALRLARRAAQGNRLQFSRHARDQMAERGAKVPDVERACITATVAAYQGEDVWRLSGGVDTAGDVLVVVASVDIVEVFVVTVFG